MARTLTAANTVLFLQIPNLFDVPQKIEGYTPDAMWNTDVVDTAEVSMGVDGKQSAGWVPMSITQNITLQGDSRSIDVFEAWYAAQQTAKEIYPANGVARVKSVNKSFTMVNGVLRGLAVTPGIARVVQPRTFAIMWERVSAAPLL